MKPQQLSTHHDNHLPHCLHPQVTKKQVDNFKEGKSTPCCQLLAEVSAKKKKVPILKRQVNLKGAKYPNNVFVISLPAGGKLAPYLYYIASPIQSMFYVLLTL